MTTSTERPTLVRYPRTARPVAVERASVVWWLAFGCWFVGSALGQFANDPAAMAFPYRYAHVQYGPLAVVLFALSTVFLASLVLPMRDGARWSRTLLTALGCPLALVLAWQFGRSVLIGTPTGAALTQAFLSLVALCALSAATSLMYASDVRAYFDGNVTNQPVDNG